MSKVWAATFLLLFASTSPGAAVEPAAAGEWLVADGTARIRIAPCKEALCGHISWTKTPSGTDERNPDQSLRNRPIMGLEILSGLIPTGSHNKWKGKVYNAENGKTYDATVTVESANVLRIEGCVLGILCGGENWTRVGTVDTNRATTGSGHRAPQRGPTR